jgi:EPS-associated MarR family transcriptional regulator
MLSDEIRYKMLHLLQENPQLSQRDVARKLGLSLGMANYCLKALVSSGWVKARNFKNSRNRIAYMYLLTPGGVEEKAGAMARFLQRKQREYKELRLEIERIRKDSGRRGGG